MSTTNSQFHRYPPTVTSQGVRTSCDMSGVNDIEAPPIKDANTAGLIEDPPSMSPGASDCDFETTPPLVGKSKPHSHDGKAAEHKSQVAHLDSSHRRRKRRRHEHHHHKRRSSSDSIPSKSSSQSSTLHQTCGVLSHIPKESSVRKVSDIEPPSNKSIAKTNKFESANIHYSSGVRKGETTPSPETTSDASIAPLSTVALPSKLLGDGASLKENKKETEVDPAGRQYLPPLPLSSTANAAPKNSAETEAEKERAELRMVALHHGTPIAPATPVSPEPTYEPDPNEFPLVTPSVEPWYPPHRDDSPPERRYWVWITACLALLVMVLVGVVLGVVFGQATPHIPTEAPTLPVTTTAPTVRGTTETSTVPSTTEAPTPPVTTPEPTPMVPTSTPTSSATPTPTDPTTPAPTDPPTLGPTDPPVPAPTDPPTLAPTDPPTPAPTDPPTPAPTTPSPSILDELIALFSNTSPATATALQDKTSNKYRSLEWLANDVEANGFDLSTDEDRILTRGVLAILFYSTNGDGWDDTAGWLDHGVSECDWYGVTCTSAVITLLGLDNDNLVGSLPREISLLSTLERLEVDYNYLPGTLATEIGRLTNMRELFLDNSQFTGSLPTEFGLLSSLQGLGLSTNSLTGTVPSELAQLSTLDWFRLDYNYFKGQVPSQVCAIDSLTHLAADCGGSPPEIECTCCTTCCSEADGCVDMN